MALIYTTNLSSLFVNSHVETEVTVKYCFLCFLCPCDVEENVTTETFYRCVSDE